MLTVDLKTREILIGPNCNIVFENDKSKKLVPSGDELIITLTMQYDDEDVKRIKMDQLKGIENTAYVLIFGYERVYGQLVNTSESPKSFSFVINFKFKQGQIVDFKDFSDKVKIGIAHDLYPYEVVLSDEIRSELVKDFS
jgi:hypothetical protein